MPKRNDCSLLPHVTENIYGLNANSCQIIGWEILLFNVQSEWKYSTGKNVKIAVIDTGCDLDHPDLKNNILTGKNFVSKKDPYDDNGHGTHVAGTIAAKNNAIGMVGVAPDAKIIPIKALDHNGQGNNSNIAKAVRWAVNNNCDFITMSLGSPFNSIELKEAMDYAEKNNVVVFCAAGNSGQDVDIMYPAKYKSTISIGSINQKLQRSLFTCAGESLDFLSPGENILSCAPNNNYAIMSGTSMANPFAVSCAALILSYVKENNIKFTHNKLSYIDLFKSVALPLKSSKDKSIQGYGIIQPACKKLLKAS